VPDYSVVQTAIKKVRRNDPVKYTALMDLWRSPQANKKSGTQIELQGETYCDRCQARHGLQAHADVNCEYKPGHNYLSIHSLPARIVMQFTDCPHRRI
jgi:hypothetical protein